MEHMPLMLVDRDLTYCKESAAA